MDTMEATTTHQPRGYRRPTAEPGTYVWVLTSGSLTSTDRFDGGTYRTRQQAMSEVHDIQDVGNRCFDEQHTYTDEVSITEPSLSHFAFQDEQDESSRFWVNIEAVLLP